MERSLGITPTRRELADVDFLFKVPVDGQAAWLQRQEFVAFCAYVVFEVAKLPETKDDPDRPKYGGEFKSRPKRK